MRSIRIPFVHALLLTLSLAGCGASVVIDGAETTGDETAPPPDAGPDAPPQCLCPSAPGYAPCALPLMCCPCTAACEDPATFTCSCAETATCPSP
jgi:hypothetical protein